MDTYAIGRQLRAAQTKLSLEAIVPRITSATTSNSFDNIETKASSSFRNNDDYSIGSYRQDCQVLSTHVESLVSVVYFLETN